MVVVSVLWCFMVIQWIRWGDADDDGMWLWSFMVIYIYIFVLYIIFPRIHVFLFLSQICQTVKNHITKNTIHNSLQQKRLTDNGLCTMAGSRQDSVGSRWQVARQRSEKAMHYKCTVSVFSANSVIVSNLPFVTKLRIQPTETKVVPVFMLKVLPKVSVSQGSCCRLVTSSEDPKQWWLSNQTMTHRWLTFIFKTQSFCFKELRLDVFCKFQFQLMIYILRPYPETWNASMSPGSSLNLCAQSGATWRSERALMAFSNQSISVVPCKKDRCTSTTS